MAYEVGYSVGFKVWLRSVRENMLGLGFGLLGGL
jgi:hypothetical protein